MREQPSLGSISRIDGSSRRSSLSTRSTTATQRARARERPTRKSPVYSPWAFGVRSRAALAAIVVRDHVRLRAREPVIPVPDRAGAVAVEMVRRPVLLEVLGARALLGRATPGSTLVTTTSTIATRREAERVDAERFVRERPRLATLLAGGEIHT